MHKKPIHKQPPKPNQICNESDAESSKSESESSEGEASSAAQEEQKDDAHKEHNKRESKMSSKTDARDNKKQGGKAPLMGGHVHDVGKQSPLKVLFFFPEPDYYRDQRLNIDDNKFEMVNNKRRVLLSKSQLKHFLLPFITLVRRFTQITKTTQWDKRLVKCFVGKYVVENAFVELSKLSWRMDVEPRKWEYKFIFQFDYRGWNTVKAIPDMEERLVLHARHIIDNAKEMIENANSREHLRFFNKTCSLYWSPAIRAEMKGKGVGSEKKFDGRRHSEGSMLKEAKPRKPDPFAVQEKEPKEEEEDSDYYDEEDDEHDDEHSKTSKTELSEFFNEFKSFKNDILA